MKTKTTKDDVERMCRAAGLIPVHRGSARGYDVLIADGFSSIPAIHFQRFGVEPGKYPFGCYATGWFVMKDDVMDFGSLITEDPLDNANLDKRDRQILRVNTALAQAAEVIGRRQKMREDNHGWLR